jgi:hypothetical protein
LGQHCFHIIRLGRAGNFVRIKGEFASIVKEY